MAISQKELELIKEDAEQHDFADFTQKRVCLGKYIEISIAKFLCTTGSTLLKFASQLRQRLISSGFCLKLSQFQEELLDVKG